MVYVRKSQKNLSIFLEGKNFFDRKEFSIFKAALQTFFKAFLGVFGVGLALIFVFAGLGALSGGKTHIPFKFRTTYLYHMDGHGEQVVHSNHVPVILRFDFQDTIGANDLNGEIFQARLEAASQGLLKNRVKGVLLYMNTPGGAVNDADQIYLALQRFKKRFQVPIYVFVDGLCASGGMYIASAADKILATTVSEIGSVGIIIRPFFNVSEVMGKIGVESKTISYGKDKDAMNPFRPWKPDEAMNFDQISQFYYNRFVDIVTSARPKISKQELINDYGAKVFVAPTAKTLGYIDEENIDYFEAMTQLCEAANINANEPYQVIEIIQEKSIFEKMVQNSKQVIRSIKMVHQLDVQSDAANEFQGKPAYILPQR